MLSSVGSGIIYSANQEFILFFPIKLTCQESDIGSEPRLKIKESKVKAILFFITLIVICSFVIKQAQWKQKGYCFFYE